MKMNFLQVQPADLSWILTILFCLLTYMDSWPREPQQQQQRNSPPFCLWQALTYLTANTNSSTQPGQVSSSPTLVQPGQLRSSSTLVQQHGRLWFSAQPHKSLPRSNNIVHVTYLGFRATVYETLNNTRPSSPETNSPMFLNTTDTKPAAGLFMQSYLAMPGISNIKPRAGPLRHSMLIALLLLLSGVESNPGPIHAGFWNVRSAVNKAALLHDNIEVNKLDSLSLCETWIVEEDSDAIKLDVAPPGYSVLH